MHKLQYDVQCGGGGDRCRKNDGVVSVPPKYTVQSGVTLQSVGRFADGFRRGCFCSCAVGQG